jgi:hypothetical protein
VADEDKGFRSIFNGLDLDGWEHYVPPGYTEDRKWKAAGGRLVAGGTNYLSTKRRLDKCELIFDWKLPAKAGNSKIVVSIGGRMQDVVLPEGTKAGGWHRQTLKSEGGNAPIQFLPAEGLEIMNVFVREQKER